MVLYSSSPPFLAQRFQKERNSPVISIIAGQLLKLVPGGSVVTGGVAAALTTGLGEADIGFLLAFHKREGRLPSVMEITVQFRSFWNRWGRKGGELE